MLSLCAKSCGVNRSSLSWAGLSMVLMRFEDDR
jgi:hypothetical protein